MKLYIAYEFRDGPWGGGNQFLKALKRYLGGEGLLAPVPEQADVILFNSHHQLAQVVELRVRLPNVHFVHRVDGPVFLIRGVDSGVDALIAQANNVVADGTIYQSYWSRQQCALAGVPQDNPGTVILNAPDPEIFNGEGKPTLGRGDKLRVIATSWSGGRNKGFDVYAWLDRNLDPARYTLTFIGNSPINFTTIEKKPPVDSRTLASLLRQSHVYITASRNDPCSNALIEAMHCGLPAIATNHAGHPEIVGNGGLLFSEADQIPVLLGRLRTRYASYQAAIDLPDINQVGRDYVAFCRRLHAGPTPARADPSQFDALRQSIAAVADKRLKRPDLLSGLLRRLKANR